MPRFYDGDWYLFHHDEKLGRTTWLRDLPGGGTEARVDYRVDPSIEVNKAQRNLAQSGWKGDYHHIASVSPGVYWDQVHKAVEQDDQAYLSKWLNNSDNRAWRTKDGRV
jgi:hypothetical protein